MGPVDDPDMLSLAYISGFILLMVHCTLRWDDALHVMPRHFGLSSNAIYGKCWKTKVQRKCYTSFAGQRLGISSVDWASRFLQLLERRGLMGADFSLEKPIKDRSGFHSGVPCDYHSFLGAFRWTLRSIGCSDIEAMSYSAHSPRHVMPDAATQAHVQESHIRQLGRWKKKTMVRVYQNDTQAIPLAITQALCKQFASGWMPSTSPEAAPPIKKLRMTGLSQASIADSNKEGSSESSASDSSAESD